MATINVNYWVLSCPVCGKKLLKVAQGAVLIGSPLITCKRCERTYPTSLRVEWIDYPHKWLLWAFPLILPALMFVIGGLAINAEIAGLAAAFGLIVGLCFSFKNVIRMLKSKKRLKDPAYIHKLFEYGAITEITRDYYLDAGK